jgi:DNA-binding NarL/FixJ family response regulator
VTIRVVVAEDSLLVREGITGILGAQRDIDVVASVGDKDTLLAAVARYEPDVVVSDIRMPPAHADEGIQAAAELRRSHPEVGVVILSQYDDPEYVLSLFDEGSDRRAYLLKEGIGDAQQLTQAVVSVWEGGSAVDPRLVERLVGATKQRGPASALDVLTEREREMLSEMASGKSNAAIAKTLFISERSVEKHINSIFSKLGFHHDVDSNRRVRAVLVYLAELNG